MLSTIVVASCEDAEQVARDGEQNRPNCDCNGENAVELLTELGCVPERIVTVEGTRPVLVWSLSTDQVSHLSELDPPTTPTDLTRWVGANVISLHKENRECRVALYRQITKLAAIALERDQSLMARIEYVGAADVH